MSIFQFGFVIGGIFVGYWLSIVDSLLYPLYTRWPTPTTESVRALFEQGNYFGYLPAALKIRNPDHRLISRSILFLVGLSLLGFYVVTSTVGFFGHGLVFGFMARRVWEMTKLRHQPAQFQTAFLWQVQRIFTDQEIIRIWQIAVVIFVSLIALWVI